MRQNRGMDNSIATGLSGLTANATWLEASASNIANAGDEAALSGPPGYQPVDVVMTSTATSGVQAQSVPVQPASVPTYDPAANAQGLVAMPNVDVATQFVNMALALASYRANIAVIRAAGTMDEEAVGTVA
jgi:flagellar basal-body rod protein FlgC